MDVNILVDKFSLSFCIVDDLATSVWKGIVVIATFAICDDCPGFVATDVSMDVGWNEGTLVVGLVHHDGGAFELLVPADKVDEGEKPSHFVT